MNDDITSDGKTTHDEKSSAVGKVCSNIKSTIHYNNKTLL